MSVPNIIERDTAKPSSGYRYAVQDIADGLRRWELWLSLGYQDIRQRYRRSSVGPFWLTISMGMMVGGLAYLYAGLFNQDIHAYLPYVATGLIVFGLISSLITDASTVFIAGSRAILQVRAPISVYLYQMVWRNLIIFAHNMVIYIIVVLAFRMQPHWVTLLALVGILLTATLGVWTGIVLGALSARFRDVPPIVGTVVQVVFFLTPIFWRPEQLPDRALFVNMNPFFHWVEIVRFPLLGQPPRLSTWIAIIGLNVVGAVVALIFFAKYRARIAYWV
jgi:ABC-type polysaccharide/polyol phosphate export permease